MPLGGKVPMDSRAFGFDHLPWTLPSFPVIPHFSSSNRFCGQAIRACSNLFATLRVLVCVCKCVCADYTHVCDVVLNIALNPSPLTTHKPGKPPQKGREE